MYKIATSDPIKLARCPMCSIVHSVDMEDDVFKGASPFGFGMPNLWP